MFGWEIHEGGSDQFLYGEVHPPDGQHPGSLGGATVMPPMDMGDVSFAMLSDPQGLRFGLYKRIER